MPPGPKFWSVSMRGEGWILGPMKTGSKDVFRMPRARTQSQTMPGTSHAQIRQPTTQKCSSCAVPPEQILLKILPCACRIPPMKFAKNSTSFYPTGSSTKKRKRQATIEKSTLAGSRTTTGPSSNQQTVLLAISWITCRLPTRTTCCSWIIFTTLSCSSTC